MSLKGDRSYEVKFLPWAEVVRVARENYEEFYFDPDNFAEADAEQHVCEWDDHRLARETRYFATLRQVLDFIKSEMPRYQITIRELRYAPGLYRNSDWELMHEWKVYPTRVKSISDICKQKSEGGFMRQLQMFNP